MWLSPIEGCCSSCSSAEYKASIVSLEDRNDVEYIAVLFVGNLKFI